MQVVHRNGEDRADRISGVAPGADDVASDIGSHARSVTHTALEIRASELTAVAVAAAAVTSAVATAEVPGTSLPVTFPAQKPTKPEATLLPEMAEPATAPAFQSDPIQSRVDLPEDTSLPSSRQAASISASLRSGKLLASWLSWMVVGAMVWWSMQWPWPEHGLKPVVTTLPTWSKPVTSADVAATRAESVEATSQEVPPDAGSIALLQQEAEEKAHLLAQKRATAEMRRQKEDAVQALREKRRRVAEAELAEARANAERAQRTAPAAAPAVIDVPVAPPLTEQVRQCQAQPLMARETCLRSLCNGKWGQQGCPAYDATYDGA